MTLMMLPKACVSTRIFPRCNLSNTVKLQRQQQQLHARISKQRHTASPSSSKEPSPTTAPKAFIIGTVAGLMGSLAGMGGGFVMIPLMTSRRVLGLTQHQAHGTSLFAVAATGLAGAVSYGDQVDWTSAAAIALTGIFTARLGAKTTGLMTGRHLKQALGVLMLCMVPAIPLKKHIAQLASEKEAARTEDEQQQDENPNNNISMVTATTTTTTNSSSGNLFFDVMSISPQRILAPAAIGVVSGFLAGLFGVGGGTLVVPALTVCTDCTHYQALATSLAAMALPAIMGTRTHYLAGNVVMKVAPALATGAFVGAYCGGKIGLKIDETVLQWGFSGLLLVLGVRTIVKA